METKISDRTKIFAAAALFVIVVAAAFLNANTESAANAVEGPGTTPPAGSGSDALVTIIEYSDFQCPYCSRVVPTIKKIEENYGGDVKIIFKHFPLSFHPDAQKAAEASECARDQGKFWEYHDKLFENQVALKVDDLKKYARELGLDPAVFNSCLDSGEKESLVKSDLAEGQSKGVRGTPSFLINGQLVVGTQPYEKFAEVIDVMLEVESGGDKSTGVITEVSAQKNPAGAGGDTGIREVQAQPRPVGGGGGCRGACGRPTCGARTGGGCGCGG